MPGNWVKAENAKKIRSVAHVRKSSMELSGRLGQEIEEELVDPGCAMNGAAFDFHQIDAVARKGLEGGKERAGFVRKTESDGHF